MHYKATKADMEGYLSLPWTWHIEEDADDPGTYVVTIDEMADYFAAGRGEADAWINARDALLAYLDSYHSTGTPIPIPVSAAPDWKWGTAVDGAAEMAAPLCITGRHAHRPTVGHCRQKSNGLTPGLRQLLA
jgi:predicted RNase H-like HicB family nuclease